MIKNPRIVYFLWSCSNVYAVEFATWKIMRMSTGGKDTNKLGVGCILRSNWLFDNRIYPHINDGGKRGEHILAPIILFLEHTTMFGKELVK